MLLRWAFEFSFSKGMPGKNGEEGTRSAIQKKTRQKEEKLEKSEKPPGSDGALERLPVYKMEGNNE